ncbi:unnamed protein product [Brassica napus]|uniref:non-specific serine/threonine protein kinase n=1 Tax=Brassica napus TaxID=3708 RepID=A0A816RME9_BRANA|nr:unnamed protein product [Brassica napus]
MFQLEAKLTNPKHQFCFFVIHPKLNILSKTGRPDQSKEGPTKIHHCILHKREARRRRNHPPGPTNRRRRLQQPSPKAAKRNSILENAYEDVKLFYTLGKELGRGQFGVTYLCTENSTGKKSISKKKLVTKADKDDMRREIQIMQHLSGQPNIVEFKGAYEDKKAVNLVMELCAGGELFDRIIAKGNYSERAAASVCRQIVNVVKICHFMGMLHRDLKPENILLSSKDDKALIKATDFGLSVFIEEGKVYKDIVGSAYYVAPEVLRQRYMKEVDIWSAGIILYILLSGVPPFWAETEKGIIDAILEGHIDFESQPWPSICNSAKDLVRRMLAVDPKRRISAADVLQHPWLREGGEASEKPIDSVVLSRMKQFRAMNKLKKLALKTMKAMFANIDTDNSGTITYEKLKEGLAKLGSKLTEVEVKQLMDAADVDGNGSIDDIEFITATMHRHRLESDENLYKAFQHFDKDGSGYITIDELEVALKEYRMGDDATIKEVLSDVDTDNVKFLSILDNIHSPPSYTSTILNSYDSLHTEAVFQKANKLKKRELG